MPPGEGVEDDVIDSIHGGLGKRELADGGAAKGMSVEEILNMMFTIDEEAYEFYKEFGKYHEAAIAYLEGQTEAKSMAMAVYNVTEDGMLGNLFWANGRSRLDY
ncbi:hypothetical protein PIB30_060125 [Stylosanthes scabra]|uniref:Uncharacterized protein n=1 Tax=Stylosanthes scabra TaxID=79078 RepID=A0ABU6XLE9_9FABA|nr:hypothetical protein [Stylosanthes scabra]